MKDFLKQRVSEEEQRIIDIIAPAIQSRNLVRFWYENGHRKEWRVVEPYVIGCFSNRNVVLSAWLIPTPEQLLSGQREGWRSFTLKNLTEIQVLEDKFTRLRDGYDPGGNGMSNVICRPMQIA